MGVDRLPWAALLADISDASVALSCLHYVPQHGGVGQRPQLVGVFNRLLIHR